MSKCNKVKNPCKICLGTVSQKTGLQCQGACQSWVHYSCLNYTPGKIKDIKTGIIKVTCPCPDCKTTMPKEYRTDQPYSCNNSACPANRPPKCENHLCPINDPKKGGMGLVMREPPCPLGKCGADCKQYSNPQLPAQGCPPAPVPGPPCVPAQTMHYPAMSPPMSSSDACISDLNRCPSGCSSMNGISGDMGYRNMGGSMPSFHVVEQMCNTVGQLTNQINDLMSKMKEVVKDKNSPGHESGGRSGKGSPKAPCVQKGPKALCPKPCFCPGNPGKRN